MNATARPWKVVHDTLCIVDDRQGHICVARLVPNGFLSELEGIAEKLNTFDEAKAALKAVMKVAPGFHDIPGVHYQEAESLYETVKAVLAKMEG